MPVMHGKQLTLKNGRALGFAEYGDPAGSPVFYFHGFPGSRLEGKLLEPAAIHTGARIIAVDRPGYGLSDFKPDRAIGEWGDDVLALAESLSIDRFAVLGVSGGGPYALSCARRIPDRLNSTGVVCGLGPLDAPGAARGMSWVARLGFLLARRSPGAMKLLYGLLVGGMIRRRPELGLWLLTIRMPPADRQVLKRPEIRSILISSIGEGFRIGTEGAARDLLLYAQPWGFQLSEIFVPVCLWHGEADAVVPPSMGRAQAEAIPDCQATFVAGEGHFSLPINHMEKILARMLHQSVTGRPART
jgi:pimeloyl-ACP methyl ester carboxylesterase